ncbi:MAG: hypothetical protein LBK72_06370, partial [Bifidobacteriaceae bacterium]|nr:hypothetical protein [Bifidobacteriaceae bacterium]
MRTTRVVLASLTAALLGVGTVAAAADPPVTVGFTTYAQAVVFPALTGAAETVTYDVRLGRAANVTLDVVDSADGLVRTIWAGRSQPSGTTRGTWDFTDASGAPVADGVYTFRASAVDSDGNTAEATWRTGIDRHAPLSILGVGEGAEVSGTVDLALINPPDLAIRNVRFYLGTSASSSCHTSAVVPSPDEEGYFRGAVDDAEGCGAGTRYIWAGFELTDALGYTRTLSTGATAVVVSVVDVTGPEVLFRPVRTMYLSGPAQYESQAVYVDCV